MSDHNFLDELFQQLPFIGSLFDSTNIEYDVKTVRALGIAQLKWFEMFGGLGYHHADADATLTTATGTVIDLDASDRGTTAVVGIQFDGKPFSYRFQHEWFDADDRLDLSNTSFGFLVRF